MWWIRQRGSKIWHLHKETLPVTITSLCGDAFPREQTEFDFSIPEYLCKECIKVSEDTGYPVVEK